MKASVVWVGRAFAALGLATVLLAVLKTPLWALLAAAGGFIAATGFALAPVVRVWLADQPVTRASDIAHVVELLRRAYGGRAAWAVGVPDGDLELVGRDPVGREVRRRGAAIVQLASIDGRAHVARESEGTYVAVGDFPFGAGVLLVRGDVGTASAEEVVDQLRRVVAGMRVGEVARAEPGQLVAKQLAAIASGAQTLEGVARAGVELAQQFTGKGAAIALAGTGAAPSLAVIAVSTAADKRLEGQRVPESAPAARAMSAGVPVVSHGTEDVLGIHPADRRRRDRAGTAFPLHDGNFAIGVLVITGAPLDPASVEVEQVQRLVAELGGRLAAARAVHEAERRAITDQLTGLPNRREFDRQRSRMNHTPPVTLIFLDLDRFKDLNDTLGHVAGDSALRHVARLLDATVRDQDIAARVGGEEFAVWMPETPLAEGMEVAERIRRAVETTMWHWQGTPRPLTLSCGVATFPDTVADPANLPSAADAALYRAKQAGRNRVEKATARV